MDEFNRRSLETLINWLVDLKEPELSHLNNFWTKYQDVTVANESEIDWINEFTDYLMAQKDAKTGNVYARVMTRLIDDELKQSSKY
jgi:hypothetical protein